MAMNYKDYCRKAVARDPKLYGEMFEEDGTRKPAPNLSRICRNKTLGLVPKKKVPIVLNGQRWKKKEALVITGTELKKKERNYS